MTHTSYVTTWVRSNVVFAWRFTPLRTPTWPTLRARSIRPICIEDSWENNEKVLFYPSKEWCIQDARLRKLASLATRSSSKRTLRLSKSLCSLRLTTLRLRSSRSQSSELCLHTSSVLRNQTQSISTCLWLRSPTRQLVSRFPTYRSTLVRASILKHGTRSRSDIPCNWASLIMCIKQRLSNHQDQNEAKKDSKVVKTF